MPHQDKRRDSVPAYNHQALREALDWAVAEKSLSSVQFRKESKWTVRGLVYAALLWVWSDESSLTKRFATARKIACRALALKREPATTSQAFLKLLRRWTVPLVLTLTAAWRERLREEFPDRYHVAGWLVFAADGSRVDLARTVSNEQRFSAGVSRPIMPRHQPKPPCKKRNKKRKPKDKTRQAQRRRVQKRRAARKGKKPPAGPQLWLTLLWHVGTQLPWAWRIGASDSSEREHLQEMLSELPALALLVADAGFVGYDFWKAVLDSDRQFVIRVGANVRLLTHLGYAKEKAGLVYLWPEQAMKKEQPPLVLRLIVVHDGRHPVYLVTSVRDASQLSDQQIVESYRARWGIEVFFRHFKQTFERRKLRSEAAEKVQVEAQWSLRGLWAMCLHAQWKLAAEGVRPERMSVAQVLQAYRSAMREYKSRPDAGEDLWTRLACAVKDKYHRKNKTSRNYPRKKQEPPPGTPEIVRATREQVERARDLKRQNKYPPIRRLTA